MFLSNLFKWSCPFNNSPLTTMNLPPSPSFTTINFLIEWLLQFPAEEELLLYLIVITSIFCCPVVVMNGFIICFTPKWSKVILSSDPISPVVEEYKHHKLGDAVCPRIYIYIWYINNQISTCPLRLSYSFTNHIY